MLQRPWRRFMRTCKRLNLLLVVLMYWAVCLSCRWRLNVFKPFFFLPCLRDLDKIDDLMQDITEQQDIAREITDAISRPSGEMFDEVWFLFVSYPLLIVLLFLLQSTSCLLFPVFCLGWVAGRAARAGAGGDGGRPEEYRWTAKCS